MFIVKINCIICSCFSCPMFAMQPAHGNLTSPQRDFIDRIHSSWLFLISKQFNLIQVIIISFWYNFPWGERLHDWFWKWKLIDFQSHKILDDARSTIIKISVKLCEHSVPQLHCLPLLWKSRPNKDVQHMGIVTSQRKNKERVNNVYDHRRET
jgi:hypothetical protein